MESSQNNTRILESLKHDYDAYKHLTTLSTGSILIRTTFLDKIFKNPEWKCLIIFCLIFFVLSIIGCVASLFGISASMNSRVKISKIVSNIFMYMALVGFLLGLISLVVFSIINLL
jgi:hypothetical protein